MIIELPNIPPGVDDFTNIFEEGSISFTYTLTRIVRYNLVLIKVIRNGRVFKRALSTYTDVFLFSDFKIFSLSSNNGVPRIYISQLPTPTVAAKKVF